MKVRRIVTLLALTLAALPGVSAWADDAATTPAWQEPGYVMDVVIVTAPRPTSTTAAETAETSGDVALAWQEPGYVEDVVVVTASRREVRAATWLRLQFERERRPFMGLATD
jgi:hypothetical protein